MTLALVATSDANPYLTHLDRAGIWEPSVAYKHNYAEFHNLAYLLGSRRHRMALRWDEIEPNPPTGGAHTYTWPVYADEAYGIDLAAGRRPVIALYAAPWWTWGSISCKSKKECEGNVPPDPTHLTDWNAFVYQAARHFPNADLEIWNEPNFQRFWGCKFPIKVTEGKESCDKQLVEPSAYEYTKLLEAAHSAIADANRDMEFLKIPHSVYTVGGALATIRGEATEGSLPIYRFAKRMIEDKAMEYLDAFSIHAYPMFDPNKESAYDARTLKPAYCQLAGPSTGECSYKSGSYKNWWGDGALLLKYSGLPSYANFSNVWITELGASRTGSEYVTQRQQGEINWFAVNWLDELPKVKAWFVGPLFSERNPFVPGQEPTNSPGSEEKDWGLSLTEWVRPYSESWTPGSEYAGVTPVLAFSRIRETMKEHESTTFFDAAFDSFQGNGIRFVTRCDLWCVARISSGWVKTSSGATYQMVWDDPVGWGAAGTVMSYFDNIVKGGGAINYPPESTWRWMTFKWAGAATPTPTSWCVNLTAVGWQGEVANRIISSPVGKTC